MANNIYGLFSSPEEIQQARMAKIESNLQQNAPRGWNTGAAFGQAAREGANRLFGITSPEEKKAAEIQAMAQSGSYDITTPAGINAFAKDLNGLGYTKEALALLEKAKTMQGSSTYGTEKEIKDSQGNIYKVTTKRTAGGYETVYTPISPNAPAKPVGQVEIIGAYGETSSERLGRDVGTAGEREDAKLWSEMRGAAVEKFAEARSAITTINEALTLASKVATGGKVQEIAREMERLTGTMPADKAELIYLLNENILKQLKPTFGAQFTAKEGEWLARIMPNENDSNEALVRKLERIRKFTQDKAAQQMSLLKSKSYKDYTDTLTSDGSISWIDEDLKTTSPSVGVPTKRYNPATGKVETIAN